MAFITVCCMIKKTSVSFFLTFFLACFVFAQKNFQVTIILNDDIDDKKVSVYVDNGKTEYRALEKVVGNVMNIGGPYFGEYAQITIRYPRDGSSNFLLTSTFFVTNTLAEIRFKRTGSAASVLDHYSLKDATDFKEEKEKMSQYNSEELKRAESFVEKHGSEIFNDTILTKKFFDLESAIYDKSLKYILENRESYYAFSFFRRNYVIQQRISSDSILSILDSFPDRFKRSFEGNFIRELMHGRSEVKKGGQAPDFQAKDISGRSISLKNYTNKEFVLLNFWATWCGPCLEEMPVMKKIYENYSKKGLTMISVAYPSTYESFEKDIEKYEMDWINIYNDLDLINSYGGDMPIPRIYLIDKTGKIVYDRQEASDDTRLIKLNELLSSLFNDDVSKKK